MKPDWLKNSHSEPVFPVAPALPLRFSRGRSESGYGCVACADGHLIALGINESQALWLVETVNRALGGGAEMQATYEKERAAREKLLRLSGDGHALLDAANVPRFSNAETATGGGRRLLLPERIRLLIEQRDALILRLMDTD